MPKYDEKRSYTRMTVDCELRYKLAGSKDMSTGRCTSISAASIAFIADSFYEIGRAMIVQIDSKKVAIPPMTAFIEIIRVVKLNDGKCQIAAVIKSIKGD